VHERGGVLFDTARQVSREPVDRRRDGEYASLVPVLECVEALGHGKLRAHFGYENDSEDELYVPLSERNNFRPSPRDRDQPSHFKPGKHEQIVSVTFEDSESVTWALDGEEAWADSDSPRCGDESHLDAGSNDHGCTGAPDCPAKPATKPSTKPSTTPATKPPTKPACDSCDASCGSPEDEDTQHTSPPAHDAGCGCDDAGAAPSDTDTHAAVGDKSCPKNAEFAASCVGALHCGPYQGPLQAKCSRSCCSHPVTFTVPLPTIAECIGGRWTFSIDPDDSTDACSEPHACDC